MGMVLAERLTVEGQDVREFPSASRTGDARHRVFALNLNHGNVGVWIGGFQHEILGIGKRKDLRCRSRNP